MTTFAQRSFAGGEIAPSLYARVDTQKYASGCRTCRNMMVMRHGGLQNRPGTGFLAEVKDSTKTVRLIPFVFNAEQTYVLEFGNLYIRFYRDGAQVESAGSPYEISSPYVEADLARLHFVQSADVITIVHPNYEPRELSRTGHTSWSLDKAVINPQISFPTVASPAASANAGSAKVHRYRITAIDAETGEESLGGYMGGLSLITGITKASPGVVTFTAGFSGFPSTWDEEEVYFTDIVGMTELNNKAFRGKWLTATTFSLKTLDGVAVDTTGYGTYVSGGKLWRIPLVSSTEPNTSSPITLTWFPVTGAKEYAVYKEKNGSWGFLGTASNAVLVTSGGTQYIEFKDVGLDPDMEDSPPAIRNPFDGVGNYPSTVSYFQQRRGYANTSEESEKVWLSQTGRFTNFTTHAPIQDDDAITFTMTGRRVNEVRHLVDLGKLLILTSEGEHAAEGDAAGVITPTDINLKQYSYNGSSWLQPLIIGNNALYVQARGSIVRDLAASIERGYEGGDLTIFAAHMFDRYTIVDWAYQQTPHSVVWVVRSDGALLGLTYIREHQIAGWHRHDTDGLVENVCVVPEGTEDAVYMVVKRTIDGTSKRYVERMKSRQISDIVDAVFMDSSLTFDGRNDDDAHTMTLSGGTSWLYTETLNLTSSASFFTAGDVGNQIHLNLLDDDGEIVDRIRFTIEGYTSGTLVTGKPHKTVPAGLRSVAVSSWARAVDEVSGLDHLEGKDVSVFADGYVVASPNDPDSTVLTVTAGVITLDQPYAVIHVGLPYLSDVETLDLDTLNGETLINKKKLVTQVSMHVEASRGIWAGAKPPEDDETNPVEGLNEAQVRNNEDLDAPVELVTDVLKIHIRPEWNSNGRIFIRQIDPLPMAVLSVAPTCAIAAGG